MVNYTQKDLPWTMQNLDKVDWMLLSKQEWALPLLMKHPDKVHWKSALSNPRYSQLLESFVEEWALPLLMKHPDKMDWEDLSCQEWALPLLMKHPDKVHWAIVSCQEWALPLLMKHPDKVHWKSAPSNPRYSQLLASFVKEQRPVQTSSNDLFVEAEAKVAKMLAEAESKVAKMLADAEEKANKLLADAESKVAKMLADAEEKANKLLADAEEADPEVSYPMTFRDKERALAEAYGVADPCDGIQDLVVAMTLDPEKGCEILEVEADPVKEYVTQWKEFKEEQRKWEEMGYDI